MTKLQYCFTITDQETADQARDYISMVKVGVNLTEEYLSVYPTVENDALVFDISIYADLRQNLNYRFLREFLNKFSWELDRNKLSYTVTVI